MHYHERIPQALFRENGHYIGRPADPEDRIISRRIRILQSIPDFIGENYSLLDIGCGNGASMFALAGKMKHCHGIEINNDHEND